MESGLSADGFLSPETCSERPSAGSAVGWSGVPVSPVYDAPLDTCLSPSLACDYREISWLPSSTKLSCHELVGVHQAVSALLPCSCDSAIELYFFRERRVAKEEGLWEEHRNGMTGHGDLGSFKPICHEAVGTALCDDAHCVHVLPHTHLKKDCPPPPTLAPWLHPPSCVN